MRLLKNDRSYIMVDERILFNMLELLLALNDRLVLSDGVIDDVSAREIESIMEDLHKALEKAS